MEKQKPTIIHQIVVLAFSAALLWGVAFYWWYYTTRHSRLVLLGTCAVIPVPFCIWLAVILGGKLVQRAKRDRQLRFAMGVIVMLAVLGITGLLLPRLITTLHARQRIFSVEDVTQKRVAIVFGAGITRDGRPMPMLAYRVGKAAELYFAGKVEKLLMSGDNRFVHYDEPTAMREYALTLGVPDEAIVLDYAGRRTYDTCYRARDIFQVQDVILVTQGYHLPRALYTCNVLGIDAVGVAAEQSPRSHLYDNVREFFATVLALGDVHVLHPVPVLGSPEPVFSSPPSLDDRNSCKSQPLNACD